MKRLDIFLVENKYYLSRQRARTEIENGNIMVDGKIQSKPSYLVKENSEIKLCGEFLKYVSRAGLKLEKAKLDYGLNFSEKVVLDIGSSTGGFCDFCLKNGAKKVYAVDVGTNQLHNSLREDSRVVVMESTDIREVNKNSLDKIDIAVCDVSFISLTKIASSVADLLEDGSEFVALIKPQFECGKDIAKKCRGVVKDEKIHKMCIDNVLSVFIENGFENRGVTLSPIKGGDGNVEFLSYFVKKHSQKK